MSTKSASAATKGPKTKEQKLTKTITTNKVAEVKNSNAFKSIYQYPEGLDADAKKAFRRQARAKKARYEKQILSAKPEEKKTMEKEFNSWKEKVYA